MAVGKVTFTGGKMDESKTLIKEFPELGKNQEIELSEVLEKCKSGKKKVHSNVLNFEHQLKINKQLKHIILCTVEAVTGTCQKFHLKNCTHKTGLAWVMMPLIKPCLSIFVWRNSGIGRTSSF